MTGRGGLIERVGAALYGERWVSDLARELGVNRATVQRWHRGEAAVPLGVWRELRELIEARGASLQELRAAIAQIGETDEQDDQANA